MNNPYVDSDLAKAWKRNQASKDIVPIFKNLSAERKIERSLSILKSRLGEALQGRVESAIHVFSGDAGTGKSTTVQSFIREWKASGFALGGSMLIVLGTLAEIDAYIARSGLDQADYAVVTSDQKYNAYGLGFSRATQARTLFTTHEQFRRRVMATGSFQATVSFHFMSAHRSVIVWDEGFLATQHASLSLNDLLALPSALGRHSRAVQIEFEALLPDKADRVLGGHIALSPKVADLARTVALADKPKLTDKARRTLEAISKLGGSKAYFRGDHKAGWSLIGRGLPLPADIGPMIVLDASARLTGNYSNMQNYGMKVVHMEPALVSYTNLKICWWDKGCGQTVLTSQASRATIIQAIADLINSKPGEDWLIVHRKDFGKAQADGQITLPDDLFRLLDDRSKAHSLTWGRHLGSNAYRDIANVIVLGSYAYGDGAYEAIHLATSGQQHGVVSDEERRAKEGGEFLHNLYQAVCRSRVRHQAEGVCAAATAYLIMARSDRREALVTRAFPDCEFEVWEPVPMVRKSKAQHVIEVLAALFAMRTVITKQELIVACGGNDRSYLDKVFRSAGFKAFAAADGIKVKGGMIYRGLALLDAA